MPTAASDSSTLRRISSDGTPRFSQPNATYKVNALAAKGYVEKIVSKPDRREVRLRTAKKFEQYFDEDRPAIEQAAAQVRAQFSEGEIETARNVLDAMLRAMQNQKERT